MQHLINILAPNLIKLTSRKRDIHERKCVKWGMMTDTVINPNILLIKVLRSHLQL